MKKISLERANLEACVSKAQSGRVVITRKGRPVALLVGVSGMDAEQLQLGSSDKFWELIAERRRQETISRTKLEQTLNSGK